jgi:hypothetical protein
VAELAVNKPSTRPRRRSNQRLAMTALITKAVMPVPRPTTTPQYSSRFQGCDMVNASARPDAINRIATTIIRLTP